MKLHSLTLRPDARPPKGVSGRTITAGAVDELAAIDHSVLGPCYLVRAKEGPLSYYTSAAVESCQPPPGAQKNPETGRCAVCLEPLPKAARGVTCSKGCARRLGYMRRAR